MLKRNVSWNENFIRLHFLWLYRGHTRILSNRGALQWSNGIIYLQQIKHQHSLSKRFCLLFPSKFVYENSPLVIMMSQDFARNLTALEYFEPKSSWQKPEKPNNIIERKDWRKRVKRTYNLNSKHLTSLSSSYSWYGRESKSTTEYSMLVQFQSQLSTLLHHVKSLTWMSAAEKPASDGWLGDWDGGLFEHVPVVLILRYKVGCISLMLLFIDDALTVTVCCWPKTHYSKPESKS